MDDRNGVWDGLLASIRVTAGRDTARWADPPRRLQGGYWAEVARVRLVGVPGLDGEMVARVMPDARVAAWETEIQRYVAETGFPTPHIRLASAPTTELDRAWLLMDFATGTLPLQGLSGLSLVVAAPMTIPRLPDRVARLSAELHALDPAPLIAIIGVRDEVGEYLSGLGDQARRLGLNELRESLRRLELSRPPSGRLSICHGDLHPFNVLSGPDGEVVLDWTTAGFADPLYDVAYSRLILAALPVKVSRVIRPLVDAIGALQARRFLTSYERYSNVPVDRDRLAWYTRFHATKMLVQLEEKRRAAAGGFGERHPYENIEAFLRRAARAVPSERVRRR